jgi:adenylate cyclase class 1
VTAAETRAIQQRFLALNRERLARVASALPRRQRVFVEVLPLLFHTNHPALPGFVGKDTPCGIAAYSPSSRTLGAAGRLARAFDYRRQLPRVFDVVAVYLIGSAGTLGYSDRSDFDVWLCHREDLPDEDVGELRRKADAVTAWATELGLEVHFFLVTAAAVREGRHQALSGESSGSAQHHLLLDEFYRTGLLVAGRHPLWWLVPPEHDTDYEAHAAELLRRRFMDPGEVLDFGGLAGIPAGEFLGAALWQLYKGVSSPYKSFLKILLLEAYASEFPEPALLSRDYKAAVYAGVTELDRLDPYVLMLEKAEAYLRGRDDPERLELARRCLYFKSGRHLSRPELEREPDPSRGFLARLAEGWGWTQAHVHNLDLRERWRLDRVVDERQLLVRALTRSYRVLSDFARRHPEPAAISQHDMTVLGRRLFAAFEQRSGKVQWLGPAASRDLAEPHLHLQRVHHDARAGWLLYRATGGTEGSRILPALKRGHTLLELLVWCHMNGVANTQTQIALGGSEDDDLAREAAAVLETLSRVFPQGQPSEPPVEVFNAPSRPTQAVLFLNLGVDPLASYTRQGLHLTTERLDPLSYGAREDNLCLAVDHVYTTSWREVFTHHHEGGTGLLECLRHYLEHAVQAPVGLSTHCFTRYRGPAIAQRVQTLFEDAASTFRDPVSRACSRWLLRVGETYFALAFDGERPVAEHVGEHADLIEYLGRPLARFHETTFDRHILTRSPLPTIYRANAPGRVQVFHRVNGGEAEVYVLDEHGSLFTETLPYQGEWFLLSPYARFLEAVLFRQNGSGQGWRSAVTGQPTEFHRLIRAGDGGFAVEPVSSPPRPAGGRYLEVKVLFEGGGREPAVTVYCDSTEFSTLEHGATVFARVAEHVLAMRRSPEPYPLYVTDVDLPGDQGECGPQGMTPTVRYLHYKADIERRLNRALAEQAPALRRTS